MFIKRLTMTSLAKTATCACVPKFPFPAPMPHTKEDRAEMGKQMVAFYHHCQKYNKTFSSCIGDPRLLCEMNLTKWDVEWRSTKTGESVIHRIRSVTVVFWTSQFSSRQDWTFSMSIDNKPTSYSYTVFDDKVIPLKYLPFAFLDGNEYETRRFPSYGTTTMKNEEWDNWKEKMGAATEMYRTRIYEIFEVALLPICAMFKGQKYSVLELGGGDAELGLELLDTCSNIESYTVVDSNKKSVALADRRQKCDCPFYSEAKKRLRVIEGDITKAELFETLKKTPVDVINLCGVVADQVLSLSDSKALLENCKPCLKKNGIVQIASHSAGHFSASDCEGMGWYVVNRSFTYAAEEEGEFVSEPFLVLTLDSPVKV